MLRWSFETQSLSTDRLTRHTLSLIRQHMEQAGFPSGTIAQVEIVLAEVINNIVEHGYKSAPPGPIFVRLHRKGARLWVVIRDEATAFPGGRLPDGHLPSLDVPQSELPEGGFGWHLIRAQTDMLHYKRYHGQNFTLLALNPSDD